MALIPIYWWNKEVHNFKISQDSFRKQPWANGVILLGCVAIAMLLANLPFTKDIYHNFLHTEFTMHIASPDGLVDWVFPKDMTMEKFINDILMVIFFFTVGLEIKREMVCGELSSFKKAILPVIAAFGGVVMPALIYTVVNHGTLASSGWGIPTATDIAFAVGILSILGDKVPVSLKVFLTALAIADDLIAILVVALFYGGTINLPLLGIALVVILFVAMMKHLGEKRIGFYMIPAILVWFLFYYSGIHATMTGVVMALLIPMEARYNKAKFHRRAKILYDGLIEAEQVQTNEDFPNGPERHHLRRLSSLTKKTIPPSYRLEHKLNPIVNFAIMPIFALANAGVEITDPSYFNVFKGIDPVLGSVGLGIFLGLLLGKPIGITLASWLAIKFKVGAMPSKASWPMLFAVACLGGIGFTMSIFVDTLSFAGEGIDPAVTQHLRDAGKIAILLGSLASGVLGSLLITIVAKLKKK
ncbi:MAG: Na+/H+ antiporter NhaA [Bacteroidales bacterium]|nr:Na+/H+ antiporter NhaA [Bacteroidales bacterium]MBR1782418.1 Na+/H+ antiporter NhaA [Bacteroidales bacterium]